MVVTASDRRRDKKGRELNAPCPEAPRSACYTSTPSRALLGAYSVGCVTGLENSRFSGQPVAVATQNYYLGDVPISFSFPPLCKGVYSAGLAVASVSESAS